MFENIVVRSIPGQGPDLDIGALAEIILYYGSTHLVIDYGKLCGLLRYLGEENIDFLISEGFIKVTYSMSQTGIRTNKFGPLQIHDFASFQLGGSVPKKPTAENQINQAYKRAARKPDKSSLFQKRLLNNSAIVSDFDKLSRQNLSNFAMEAIQDSGFLHRSVRATLSKLVPSIKIPDSFRFVPIKDKNGFLIDTDLDIESMNGEYHKIFSPDHSSLSQAYLLSFIFESVIDMALAAHYGSEILTSPISSEIIEMKMASLFAKIRRDESEIEGFSNFIFDGSNSIRESINSGVRSFDDFRNILLASRKFRAWIAGVNPDKNLLREYHDACTQQTWVDKLPTKSARFVLFTGGGMLVDAFIPTGLGTASGIALGAADNFLVDKILRGWKPSHFVEGILSDFVGHR